MRLKCFRGLPVVLGGGGFEMTDQTSGTPLVLSSSQGSCGVRYGGVCLVSTRGIVFLVVKFYK
jgi:hypothetical protein